MSSCVLAVELDNPITLLVVSNESASEILTLSPGQQVLPSRYFVDISNTFES